MGSLAIFLIGLVHVSFINVRKWIPQFDLNSICFFVVPTLIINKLFFFKTFGLYLFLVLKRLGAFIFKNFRLYKVHTYVYLCSRKI